MSNNQFVQYLMCKESNNVKLNNEIDVIFN